MYILGQGHRAVKAAGQHMALPGGGLALGIVTQSHHQSGCSPLAMSPVLQPRCPLAPPPAQEPTDPVPVSWPPPSTAEHGVGSRATWPWQAAQSVATD